MASSSCTKKPTPRCGTRPSVQLPRLLQLSYFRHKTVPRRLLLRVSHTAAAIAPVGPGGACCRRSAPSPAPTLRTSGVVDMLDADPNHERVLLPCFSRSLSGLLRRPSATPSPSAPPRSPPSAVRPHTQSRVVPIQDIDLAVVLRRVAQSLCRRSTLTWFVTVMALAVLLTTAPRHPFGAALPACPPSLPASRPPLSARSPRGCCAVWVPPQSRRR